MAKCSLETSLNKSYELEVHSLFAASLDFLIKRRVAETKPLFAILHFDGYRKS